jgi:hypothetical protein
MGPAVATRMFLTGWSVGVTGLNWRANDSMQKLILLSLGNESSKRTGFYLTESDDFL